MSPRCVPRDRNAPGNSRYRGFWGEAFSMSGTPGLVPVGCTHPAGIGVQPLTISPPLGWRICPEMYEESSEARKTKQVATSSGWPGRPIGTSWPNFATLSGGNVEGIKGVQIGPGATPLTRMPRLTSDWDSERVNATMAPLVEE